MKRRSIAAACMLLSIGLAMTLVVVFPRSPLIWLLGIVPIAIWTLVIWSSVMAARRLHRQNRVLNLRCPGCGFDVAQQFREAIDRCPECGEELGMGKFHRPRG